ncbi:MAG: DNA translocase FtsK 4TM domain-containing protein, partial [Sphingomonadaceae bacterium]|nr:DNA translocase FtsK 4TM domain-containing protein [Sphingomonadaceae bacterium]
MASRAISKSPKADWRVAFRRSLRRALQMTGAVALFGTMVFLALSLVSYTQTDPSLSTAASETEVANWMDLSGAWAAERLLFLFGWSSVLILPLLYVGARKLWRDVEEEDIDNETRWWSPVLMLLLGMALLSTVLALAVDPQRGEYPASFGGITGLLGAGAVEAVSAKLAGSASG